VSCYKRFNGKTVKHGDKNYARATWYVRRRIRGRLIHQSIREAQTKADAEAYEAKLVADAFAKRSGLPSKITLKEFAETAYTHYVEQHNENAYVKKLFIKSLVAFFGTKQLADITPQDCRDYQWQRKHTNIKSGSARSNASVNKETSTLSKLFSLACEQGLIHDSPMRGVKKLKEAEPRRRSLTDEQKERLWLELSKDRLLLSLVTLAVNLPLRRAQLLAITPDAIDFQAGHLLAIQSKRKAARLVPLNFTAANILRQMIADGLLPLPVNDFRKRWVKALLNAGINKEGGTREENFHFHDLRHMFGSELLKRGVSPYHIQELFGHSDMKTSAIYISPEQEQLHDAVRRLDTIESEVVQ
jgi:integrase